MYVSQASVQSVYAIWLQDQSLKVARVSGQFTQLVLLWSSYHLQDLQLVPQLLHKGPCSPSKVWLWVSASVSIGCHVDREQLCQILYITICIINSVGDCSLPMGCVSVMASQQFATLSASALSLSQHILQVGHILGGRFCAWVTVLIPSHGVLSGYRK